MVAVPASSAVSAVTIDGISYQGYLTDRNSGEAVNGDISITFRIYDTESGGYPLWVETHSLVNIDNGLFSLLLGSINNLETINFNQSLWLGVEVNGDGEMTPRYQLTGLQTEEPELPEDLSKGNFGHNVIDITIDYSDIEANQNETDSQEPCEELAIPISGSFQLPEIDGTSVKLDNTGLSLIPIEEERVFDTEDFRIYSNSPRSP